MKKIFLLLSLIPVILNAQTITTIAGNGTIGRAGDGGAATAAQIFYPFGITTDKVGNIYIADDYNYVIRKITRDGIINTIAGSVNTGYGGDGGPPLNAQFAEITSVAVDASSNVIIADNGNSRIRKLTPSGVLSTIAGNGSDTYSGDRGQGVNAGLGTGPVGIIVDAGGYIYFSDNSAIRKLSPSGMVYCIAGGMEPGFSGDGGPATAAKMVKPKGLAMDKEGNIYVADYDDNRVRKITKAGIISTFAGNGYASEPGIGAFYGDGGVATDAELSGPTGVVVDGEGNIFIGDYNNHCVRKVDTKGIITTIAGTAVNGYSGDGGPANKAKLSSAAGLTLDAEGNLYICDPVNNRVRMVSKAGVPVTPAAGAKK